MKTTSGIIIYEGAEARVEVRLERETVWLSLQQLAELFGRDKSVISRHLKTSLRPGSWSARAAGAALMAKQGRRLALTQATTYPTNLENCIFTQPTHNEGGLVCMRSHRTTPLRQPRKFKI